MAINNQFDVVKDFAPVSAMISVVQVVIAKLSLPAGSIRELIDYAKKIPVR